MKIVVLGWGSLIWNPRNLKIDRNWHTDGPYLPVEFARISQDGRLTLVLFPNIDNTRVLWTFMKVTGLKEAIENLRKREKTPPQKIGFVDVTTGESRCNVIPDITNEIREWAKTKNIDAIIWTDLCSNFKEKTSKEFTDDNVIEYLKTCKVKEKAKEYIQKTHPQIKTKMRKVIEERLGWTPEDNCG